MEESNNAAQVNIAGENEVIGSVENETQSVNGTGVIQSTPVAQDVSEEAKIADGNDHVEQKNAPKFVNAEEKPVSLFFNDDNDKDLQDFRTRADKVFTKEEQDEFLKIAKERGFSKSEINKIAKLYVKQREEILSDPDYFQNCAFNDSVTTGVFGVQLDKPLEKQNDEDKNFYKVYKNLSSTAEGARFLKRFTSMISYAANRLAQVGNTGAVNKTTADASVVINGSNFNSFPDNERDRFLARCAFGKIKDPYLSPDEANRILTSKGWE